MMHSAAHKHTRHVLVGYICVMLNVVSVNASFEYWPMEQHKILTNEKNDRKRNNLVWWDETMKRAQ